MKLQFKHQKIQADAAKAVPVSIREMLPKHDERIEKIVADYRINLVDPKTLTDDEMNCIERKNECGIEDVII